MKNFSGIFRLVLVMALCVWLSSALYAQTSVDRNYNFKVFLEDEEIGQQRFLISSNKTQTRVEIEATFDVKYWILTAYSYRHTNTEVWDGECLQMIRSKTNDNGKAFFVQGNYVDNHLTLVTHDGTRAVEGCIKTFAYWDQDFLSSRVLLNSQTGEMNQVKVNHLGDEVISVRNQPTPAIHYRIVTEKFSIDLWYSPDGEWLALQSITENDSRLRYEIQ